jgi:arylsulfatase A-like enzyme
MTLTHFLQKVFYAAIALSPTLFLPAQPFQTTRPNVLFIISDDLNDWVLHPAGHPEVLTPNLDRLRERSLSFENAHAVVPVCGASRKCLFSGLYPQTIDDYAFAAWPAVPALENVVPIPLHFRNNGYNSYGTGKLLHEGAGGDFYTEYGVGRDYGPWPWMGEGEIKHTANPIQYQRWKEVLPIQMHRDLNYGPLSQVPEWKPNAIEGIPGAKGWFYENEDSFRYVDANNRDRLPDEKYADWAVSVLEREHDRPFFLGVGFIRPHTPLYVPQKYFDRFPIEDIMLPPYLKDDRADCAPALANRWQWGYKKYEALIQVDGEKGWKEWVQAYCASVAFVDDQIGKVVNALEASPHRDNTIIILTSDHGYHLGEKDVIQKWHLWDESTRVPLFLHVPGALSNGQTSSHPVSLLDIYPTLVVLCDLPKEPNNIKLDGHSLTSFLNDSTGETWTGPSVALMAVDDSGNNMLKSPGSVMDENQIHFSVRSHRYRYTLCGNGEEELYDHDDDPHEWTNLASQDKMVSKKNRLKNEMIKIFRTSKYPHGFNPDSDGL